MLHRLYIPIAPNMLEGAVEVVKEIIYIPIALNMLEVCASIDSKMLFMSTCAVGKTSR